MITVQALCYHWKKFWIMNYRYKVILSIPKCLRRQGHIWLKFEKQVKPLGFPFFKEAPSSCPKFQINAPGAGNVWYLKVYLQFSEWLHFRFLMSCIWTLFGPSCKQLEFIKLATICIWEAKSLLSLESPFRIFLDRICFVFWMTWKSKSDVYFSFFFFRMGANPTRVLSQIR